MSSSFRRANPRRKLPNNGNLKTSSASSPDVYPHNKQNTVLVERIGTKPSKGGWTLTSSGLRELDAIIGGGQPLGTAILIEEDRWTQDLALAIVRCWSAEVSTRRYMYLSFVSYGMSSSNFFCECHAFLIFLMIYYYYYYLPC